MSCREEAKKINRHTIYASILNLQIRFGCLDFDLIMSSPIESMLLAIIFNFMVFSVCAHWARRSRLNFCCKARVILLEKVVCFSTYFPAELARLPS